MLVIGVRSSWLTLETKASLVRSISVRCATARRSVCSAASRALCARTRSVMSSAVLR